MKIMIQKLRVNRYLCLFISLILLIVTPPFIGNAPSARLTHSIFFTILLIATVYLISPHRKIFLVVFVAMIFALGFNWLSFANEKELSIQIPRLIFALIMMLFFFRQVILSIFKAKEINREIIFASLSGYILLGLTGAFLFALVFNIYPGSFNISEGREGILTFVYFSFTTLTTLGFGDIIPLNPQAQSLTVLHSISGQLYLTVLIGMIIGKYLKG